MSKVKKYLTGQVLWPLLIGVLLGAVIILAIRFATYKPEHIHYHANFAIYINGQREQFNDPALYEETGSCSEEVSITTQDRAHMHEGVNDVVHVEDHAVTWGQFFANIGWVVDAKAVASPDQTYVPNETQKITFILNDEITDNVSNRVIGDQDKLLVDYGSNLDVAKNEYSKITNKAAQEDKNKDPASCGSNAPVPMSQRFKHMF